MTANEEQPNETDSPDGIELFLGLGIVVSLLSISRGWKLSFFLLYLLGSLIAFWAYKWSKQIKFGARKTTAKEQNTKATEKNRMQK